MARLKPVGLEEAAPSTMLRMVALPRFAEADSRVLLAANRR